LPVEEPTGSVVLDIGAGTSEVAMISMGAIVATKLIPIGGHDFDQKVATHLKREHGVLIGERVAEQIKLQISSISPCGEVEIVGRDMASELLKTVRLTSQEIRGALERPVTRIIAATQEMLSRTPPELAGDVMEGGITLTGGSSHLNGLAERLRLAIGTPVRVADAPSTCIAIGLARLADKQLARSQPSVRPALSFTTSTARY
jgi:rod shape-determining protein MreB